MKFRKPNHLMKLLDMNTNFYKHFGYVAYIGIWVNTR